MPGEVGHPGSHIHSNDEKPFHYCHSRWVETNYASRRPLLALGVEVVDICARFLLVQFSPRFNRS
jgi:hypothetical protein